MPSFAIAIIALNCITFWRGAERGDVGRGVWEGGWEEGTELRLERGGDGQEKKVKVAH